jgi:glutamyl-Q tRNA(Asp) synthetase
MSRPYVGRFAPSPTGPLHAGSLVAALASWLDARAHGGRWLVRIEDVDGPRCVPGADQEILRQLAAVALLPDEPPVWQSRRDGLYRQALDRLLATGWAYPCGCTRRDIELALSATGRQRSRHGELAYPGTCRPSHGGLRGKPPRSARLACAVHPADRMDDAPPLVIDWHDRRLGHQRQDVTGEVGDFVLQRADGLWAYQLAVVVDDAEQGVTDVVRGEDLADNTPRQIHLQRCLGLPVPRYLHTPLVLGPHGEKLSKQNGAQALVLDDPLAVLRAAGRVLGLPQLHADDAAGWLAAAVAGWRAVTSACA